jgi:hypothetical protein
MAKTCLFCAYKRREESLEPCKSCKSVNGVFSNFADTVNLEVSQSDNAVLLSTIRDLAETRERLGRASGHITAARVHQHSIVEWCLEMAKRGNTNNATVEREERYYAALIAAEKEIASV